MTIQTVFFDFGGVFTFSPFSVVDDFGIQRGAAPGQFAEIMFGSYHIDGDHPWHRLERGEMSLESCREEIIALGQLQGFEVDLYEVFGSLPRDGGLRTELVDKVVQLQQRDFGLAIITNNVREFSDGWRSLFPVDELFEQVIDSSFEGVRKPNPAIFELALQRMGDVSARQSLFLDDHPANVAAAQALGFNAILVDEDSARVLAEIDQHLQLDNVI
ncbi:HAD family phosphatase [Halieaceae bacterium IMCC14734]|uniref:HAD family phosphatase n=1 Tax=Candidatus Litorirhabdus singularis TaxID=2518993 RepID=A0ABT3TAE1_9GAMM|nr:HAD family phosphatase [Candidatus Litorirhabdus singularis]MCX2979248.1 HAD family phosphatase [Candidatus Litorirhabdus singularis]